MHQYEWRPVEEWPARGNYERAQLTGKEDVNNVELCNGDIVELLWAIAEVQWSNMWGGWVFFCHLMPEWEKDLPFSNWNGNSNCNSAVKIGNKYENPDLLTQ